MHEGGIIPSIGKDVRLQGIACIIGLLLVKRTESGLSCPGSCQFDRDVYLHPAGLVIRFLCYFQDNIVAFRIGHLQFCAAGFKPVIHVRHKDYPVIQALDVMQPRLVGSAPHDGIFERVSYRKRNLILPSVR